MVFWLLILVCAFFLICGIYFWIKEEFSDDLLGAFATSLIITVIFTVLSFMAIECDEVGNPKRETEKCIPIVSLERGKTLSASFLLGSGCLNGVNYYIAFSKVGDNSFSLVKEEAEGTNLTETNDREPAIVKSIIKGTKGNKLVLPWSWEGMQKGSRKVEIFVPKGTIIRDYRVN